MTPKDVKQKAEIAFNNRDKFRSLFQDAYDYTMPTRQGFDHSNQLGQSRTDRIFDETAVVGVTEFAAELQSSLMPPFSRWANLVAGSDIEDEIEAEEVNEAQFGFMNRDDDRSLKAFKDSQKSLASSDIKRLDFQGLAQMEQLRLRRLGALRAGDAALRASQVSALSTIVGGAGDFYRSM